MTTTALKCSGTCCPQGKKLGEIVSGTGLVLVSRQHGTLHTANMSEEDILRVLSGTLESSAIVSWVLNLFL